MSYFSDVGLKPSRILLPGDDIDLAKWSVVACDQYTSKAEYWDQTAQIAGGSPSTLRMIFPECYVGVKKADIKAIHKAMDEYKAEVLTNRADGFVLVERETTKGKRIGLVAAFDLEAYDYKPGSKALIRATEGTVEQRLPPRMAIRKGASLETPHVMILIDDRERSVIEPIYASKGDMRLLYDFELMQGGGRIRGWAVEKRGQLEGIASALSLLKDKSDGFLYAVGDGNHSFAAARACWLEEKQSLSRDQCLDHPMRYALAELVNIYDDALEFEPIHRAVYGISSGDMALDFILYCRTKGMSVIPCEPDQAHLYLLDRPLRIENVANPLPVAVVQQFLDYLIEIRPQAKVDYIHGLDTLLELSAAHVRLTTIDKNSLFDYVRQFGALPRKAFSMGEASDKRYYLECRALGIGGRTDG